MNWFVKILIGVAVGVILSQEQIKKIAAQHDFELSIDNFKKIIKGGK